MRVSKHNTKVYSQNFVHLKCTFRTEILYGNWIVKWLSIVFQVCVLTTVPEAGMGAGGSPDRGWSEVHRVYITHAGPLSG